MTATMTDSCQCPTCIDRRAATSGVELIAGMNGVPVSAMAANVVESIRAREITSLKAQLGVAFEMIEDLQAANEVLRKRLILFEGGK